MADHVADEVMEYLQGQKITRHAFMCELAANGRDLDMLQRMVLGAAISQALEESHPDWVEVMETDLRTRDEWQRSDDWPLEEPSDGS